MADRNFASDLRTPGRSLVQYDIVVACQAAGAGVDTVNSSMPVGFVTCARTGVGIYTITINDKYVSLVTMGVTLGNNGTYLPAFQAQPAQYPPVATNTSNWTYLIHVGNATVLADPGVSFVLHVTMLLKNSAVVP